ncbi:valine--tRNA ligase-like [Euwallacea fornicatus]|uniref:valine--tRNA ligase-like n=1 Tax=Euwallacea fornicatus TaxID=995702 RepID=UPI00338DF703
MYKLHRQCKLCNTGAAVFRGVSVKRRWLSTENHQVNIELAEAYNPKQVEQLPFDNDYFTPSSSSNELPFSLILPPPNITGTLHLGHALTACIQDSLVKWHKIHGRSTMWVPGLDHAGIATQMVVEKKLWKEKGLTRDDLGREEFVKQVWKWKHEKSSLIIPQLRRLNVDLNWDKEVFTMDIERSKAVNKAFVTLFDQGLIYLADYIVNWSCTLQSAVSDIEVEHIPVEGPTDLPVPGYEKPVKFGVLTKFAYKVEESHNEELVVATTRPETVLGDTAVAVNPKDPRYLHLIGKRVLHPFRGVSIPVIADDFVDPEFGSGVVKVTPAHDPIDFEVGKRHNLKSLSVINEKGYLSNNNFKNIKRFEAREIILNQLAEMGLFRGSQAHKTTVPICSRSRDVIEFLVRPQWFLDCSEMAARAAADVREGRLIIDQKQFEKVWFQWLDNIRDWCISRQLWWGHRIPAYFFPKHNHWEAAESLEEAKIKASKHFSDSMECKQSEDVLDTWFSSALQPFSVFGWPQKTQELSTYYPLSLMETGHDILFFWVARMVMLGTQLTGSLPFQRVQLHGMICDSHGRKMSKSLGNVITPEEVIEGASLDKLKDTLKRSFESGLLSSKELKKALEGQQKMFPRGIPECGADALRFTLLSHNSKNYIINFDINECYTNKLFGNKVFQATKFALIWINKVFEVQGSEFDKRVTFEELTFIDRWILSRLTFMLKAIEDAMEGGNYHLATAALKNFLYYEFCDIYLEAIKTNLKDHTRECCSRGHCQTLLSCLNQSLTALFPFMPAMAQHLHRSLPQISKKCIYKITDLRNEVLELQIQDVMEVVTGIRRLKKIFNVTYKYSPEVFLLPFSQDLPEKFSQIIKDLSKIHTLHILNSTCAKPQGTVEDSIGRNKIYLTVPEELKKALEVDLEKIEAKRGKLIKELEKLNQHVFSKGYIENASIETKENDKKKLEKITEKIARIDYIRSLKR